MVQAFAIESDQLPSPPPEDSRHLIKLILLENSKNMTEEHIISCGNTESDRVRWIQAFVPELPENPDERIYEVWDCPQVQAIHSYSTQQQDELALEVSDIIKVLKKVADGWYYGERIRDGAEGWFPANHTKEIASAHVRARNLKQRYRLLQSV